MLRTTSWPAPWAAERNGAKLSEHINSEPGTTSPSLKLTLTKRKIIAKRTKYWTPVRIALLKMQWWRRSRKMTKMNSKLQSWGIIRSRTQAESKSFASLCPLSSRCKHCLSFSSLKSERKSAPAERSRKPESAEPWTFLRWTRRRPMRPCLSVWHGASRRYNSYRP